MLDREEIQGFFRFLDSATDNELAQREGDIERLIDKLMPGSDTRKDAQFLLRKLREEQADRISHEWRLDLRMARQR